MRLAVSVACAVVIAACGPDTGGGPDAPAPDADTCAGTCECVVDSDCADAHAVCVTAGADRTCECAAGYAEAGGACAWSGVVTDPGFQAPSKWILGANAAIDANLTVAGMVDPGAARWQTTGLCSLARITQAVDMPRYDRAEPLVAEITHRYVYPDIGPVIPARPAFGLDTTWNDQINGAGSPWQTARICLGPGHYAPAASTGRGATRVLTVMPDRVPTSCTDPEISFDVDHFEIKPANPGECPAPGSALNGDAEANGGWVLTGSASNGAPYSTMIEAGVGQAGTRGVRLYSRNRCAYLSATTQLAIPAPDTMPSPALAFFNRTTANVVDIATDPRLGAVDLPLISATNADQPQKLCVPATMRGATVEFRALLNISGTCANIVDATSIIDNVSVVDDPSCGTDAMITDPGFESTLALIGANSEAGKSLARILIDPQQAYRGMGALQLSVQQLCSGASWQGNFVVPSPVTGKGPALLFFYKAPPANNYTFRVSTAGATFTPVLDNTWRLGRICLDPKLALRNQAVTFAMSGGGGLCATTHAAETALVDDLVATTDAACPTQ